MYSDVFQTIPHNIGHIVEKKRKKIATFRDEKKKNQKIHKDIINHKVVLTENILFTISYAYYIQCNMMKHLYINVLDCWTHA